MPTKNVYVKPHVFMTYKGMKVYHTYESGELSEENTYYFCTEIDAADDDDSGNQFDVRDLPTWAEPPHPPFTTGRNNTPKNRKAWEEYHASNTLKKAMKSAIRKAIDSGYIPLVG